MISLTRGSVASKSDTWDGVDVVLDLLAQTALAVRRLDERVDPDHLGLLTLEVKAVLFLRLAGRRLERGLDLHDVSGCQERLDRQHVQPLQLGFPVAWMRRR